MKNVSQGSVVRIAGEFRNAAGVLANPTVVTFYVTSEGDGDSDTYIFGAGGSPVVNPSSGLFYFDQDTSDVSGLYDWRIVGTGAATGAAQGQFYVTPTNPDDDSSDCSSG